MIAIQNTLSRDEHAFRPKNLKLTFQKSGQKEATAGDAAIQHLILPANVRLSRKKGRLGCNCSKTKCLKKYW